MEIEILRWSCKCPFAGKALTGNDTVNFDPDPEFSNPAQLSQLCFPDTGKAFTANSAGCFDLASNLLNIMLMQIKAIDLSLLSKAK